MIASNQINVLKEFCALMLCGHQENAFQHCKTCMESAADEYGGIPDVLYVLSGHAVDSEDPFGNVADLEKQPVKPQYYMVSSDAGAPALEDFFWFIENIKAARGLTFSIHEIPSGILNGMNGASVSDIPAMLKDLDEFEMISKRLDQIDSNLIADCRKYYNAYKDYLQSLKEYKSFEDYLNSCCMSYHPYTKRYDYD